jgi:flagellar basal-body rod protein FlgF
MDSLSIAAASGMRSRMESLDMLANNLANADTGGYKIDREVYNLFASPEALSDSPAEGPTLSPVIEKNWTDFSQGTLRVTSNPLDFAIDGKGFFAVDSPSGVAYTRNGAFRLSSSGTLVTSDGYAVRGEDGKPLQLNSALPVEVGPDGAVRQSGQTVGRLAVMEFDDPHALVKQGSSYFAPADPKNTPHAAAAAVQQGKLEGSNVGATEAAVRLVSVIRQFEMLQKAMNVGAEMNAKAVQEVARV